MRISFNQSLNFQRKLRSDEEADFSRVLKQAKEKVGNTGHSILIVPTPSLPQSAATNTGMGNFLDEEAIKFVDFAKLYWGINTIQTLPDGKYKVGTEGGYLPYSGTAFELGNHVINLELLTKEESGSLLKKADVEKVVSANTSQVVNFENVFRPNSETEKALKKAFTELMKADTETKKSLLQEFAQFKEANKSWLEPKSVYAMLSEKYSDFNSYHWDSFDRNLYNPDKVAVEKRNKAIEELKKAYSETGEFFAFKQFMAEKHHFLAKENLNKKGLKFCGDVLVAFSNDEIWANPKAFKDGSIGWGIRALDLETNEAKDLLRAKINKFAQRYDSIRIDVSWSYSTQTIRDKHNNLVERKEFKDSILNIIDEEFKKVKGNSFRSEDIMHEFLANLEDFDIYENGQLKSFVKDRTKVHTSTSMHSEWGTVQNFRERLWNPNAYVLGTTNHDCPSMKVLFNDPVARKTQTEVLSKILKIPKEKLQTVNEFINAKFAEPMRAKHNMVFFSDALGMQASYKENVLSKDAYRLKINEDFSDKFFKSLEKGEGFNIMDALEKAFVADGLDKTEPKLFKEIVKYRKILQGKESEIETQITQSTKSAKGGAKKGLLFVGIAALSALASHYFFSNKNGSSKETPVVE